MSFQSQITDKVLKTNSRADFIYHLQNLGDSLYIMRRLKFVIDFDFGCLCMIVVCLKSYALSVVFLFCFFQQIVANKLHIISNNCTVERSILDKGIRLIKMMYLCLARGKNKDSGIRHIGSPRLIR